MKPDLGGFPKSPRDQRRSKQLWLCSCNRRCVTSVQCSIYRASIISQQMLTSAERRRYPRIYSGRRVTHFSNIGPAGLPVNEVPLPRLSHVF